MYNQFAEFFFPNPGFQCLAPLMFTTKRHLAEIMTAAILAIVIHY